MENIRIDNNMKLTGEEYWQMRSLVSEIRLSEAQLAILANDAKIINSQITSITAKKADLNSKREILGELIARRTILDFNEDIMYSIEIDEQKERGEIIVKH